MDDAFSNLTDRLGARALHQLASAYETAILAVSQGEPPRMPDRRIRQAMVDAMLSDGQRGGFEASRLSEVGASAARAERLPPIRLFRRLDRDNRLTGDWHPGVERAV